jgi:hypothetical protein
MSSSAAVALDVETIIKEVAGSHQVLLTPNDPILVSLSLNRVILGRYVEAIEKSLEEMTQSLQAQRKVESLEVKRQLEELLSNVRGLVMADAPKVVDSHARSIGVDVADSLQTVLAETKNLYADAAKKQVWVNVLLVVCCLMSAATFWAIITH